MSKKNTKRLLEFIMDCGVHQKSKTVCFFDGYDIINKKIVLYTTDKKCYPFEEISTLEEAIEANKK